MSDMTNDGTLDAAATEETNLDILPSPSCILTNVTIDNNVIIAQGPTIELSYAIAIIQNAGNTIDGVNVSDNYIDATGAYGAFYQPSTGTGISFGNNIDMVTGGIFVSAPVSDVVSIAVAPVSGNETANDSIVFTLSMDEAFDVTGTPVLLLNNGGEAIYTGGSGTSTLTFQYTVAGTDTPVSSLAIAGISLPTGTTVVDASGFQADFSGIEITFPGLAVSSPDSGMTTTYNDGAAGAPAGTPQLPDLLANYAAPPPWEVAGVDYAVGVPAGTVLQDPASISLPGVTVDAFTHTITVTASNVTLNGADFGLDGGWGIEILAGVTDTVIENSHFLVGSNNNIPVLADPGSGSLTLLYNTFDGGSSTSGAVYGLVSYSGSGTITAQYNSFMNAPSDAIDLDDGTVAAVFEYNLFEDLGTAPGSHPDTVQFVGVTANSVVDEFNTIYQAIPGGMQGVQLQAQSSPNVLPDLTGSGTVTIEAGAYLDVVGAISSTQTIIFNGAGAILELDDPADAAGPLVGFTQQQTIDLAGVVPGSVSYSPENGGLLEFTFASGGTGSIPFLDSGPVTSTSDNDGGADVTAMCFCAGTLIGTPRGEIPVEKLAVGDIVNTWSGKPHPITWIGVGRILATRGRRNAATPVIVRKGALAENVPNRDLHVTKGHAFLIDGVLIPVEYLVNHRSILWDDLAQEVALYHIELDSHDVLIANGAPAESYRDDGNRWLFCNFESGRALPPQEPCAPVLTGGPMVDAAWRRLLDRSGPRPGLILTADPDPHLLLDGTRCEFRRPCNGWHVIRLPECPGEVRLRSRAASPAEIGLARDPRVLGVALRQIRLFHGREALLIHASDPRLRQGFHDYEPDCGVRWTSGDAVLPAELFQGFTPPIDLELWLDGSTQYAVFDTTASPAEGESLRDAAA